MAGNRLINKESNKGNKKSPLSSSGIVDEVTPIEEEKIETPKVAEIKTEEPKKKIKEQPVEVTENTKHEEVAVEKTEAEIVKPQNENLFDLFNIKKKEKIQKGQKNLVLKLSNIEFLEELAHNTKRDQGEIVDTLLENLAKMMQQ